MNAGLEYNDAHGEWTEDFRSYARLRLVYKKNLTNTKVYRIVYLMKVTAIIDDDLVNNVKVYTQSSTVTEAITIALKDWLDIYNIKEMNKNISKNPIFIDNGQQIREINRSI